VRTFGSEDYLRISPALWSPRDWHAEAVTLFQEARQSGDPGEAARRRLIESHLRLILPVAMRYAASGLSMLDLIQEGNLSLMRALERHSGADL
jgi:DNA-directed RNA polymerase sigma subunit (sigma70/sigma32)